MFYVFFLTVKNWNPNIFSLFSLFLRMKNSFQKYKSKSYALFRIRKVLSKENSEENRKKKWKKENSKENKNRFKFRKLIIYACFIQPYFIYCSILYNN